MRTAVVSFMRSTRLASFLPTTVQLQALFARLNAEHFGGALRAYRIEYNARLRTVTGRISYRPALIELSLPLMTRHPGHLPETLLHEMVHAWLHCLGLPSGHGSDFKAKMRAVGLSSIYHALPVARRRSRRRYVLECPRCRVALMRRRHPGSRVSCARCAPHGFDSRVEMRVRPL